MGSIWPHMHGDTGVDRSCGCENHRWGCQKGLVTGHWLRSTLRGGEVLVGTLGGAAGEEGAWGMGGVEGSGTNPGG